MRLVNLRPYRVALLLLALLAAAWSLGVVRITAATSFAETVHVSGLWGSGPFEFGRAADAIGRAQGPCAFAVDTKGAVVIADTANRRTVRYDARGRPDPGWQPQGFAGLAATAMAVDGRGLVYAGDAARGLVVCLDSRGAHVATVALAGDPAAQQGWTLCGLAGHPQAGFYALLAGWPPEGGIVRVVRYDPDSRNTSEVARYVLPAAAAQPQQGADLSAGLLPADLCAGTGGLVGLVFRTGAFGVRLAAIGPQGAELWTRDISRENMIRRAALLGADARGRLYLALDYGQTAEVLSIGARGEADHVAAIPPFRPPPAPGGAPYALVPARVDQRGRLYLVGNTEERFRLLRLTPSARPRLIWWFR